MNCQYRDCPNHAAFECECEGEEKRRFCAPHTLKAAEICELFGWTLAVRPIDDVEARPS